ncbi:MAG TPA: hypothetical protein VG944_00610 [Fimbriimonas sp.]|nr:hypothetical protein [Fimbriimonas sp.]
MFRRKLTQDDVLAFIDAVRRMTLGDAEAGTDVDRRIETIASSGLQGLEAVIDALSSFGARLQRQVPRDELEPMVIRLINTSPESKSPAAVSAINELGRALFLGDGDLPIPMLLAIQGRDSRLSQQERSGNLLNLTIAAGWIAAELPPNISLTA